MRTQAFLLAFLCSSIAAVSSSAGQYNGPNQATSIQPLQEKLRVAVFVRKAGRGDRVFTIDSRGTNLDPRQWVLFRNADGSRQEIQCIRSIQQDTPNGPVTLKLTSPLRFSYPAGAALIQTSVARERGVVGVLTGGGKLGALQLVLDSTAEIDVLEQVVVQSPDGGVREAHCVHWVNGREVRLFDGLHRVYPANSLVLQGGLIEGEVEREDVPCLCRDKSGWEATPRLRPEQRRIPRVSANDSKVE